MEAHVPREWDRSRAGEESTDITSIRDLIESKVLRLDTEGCKQNATFFGGEDGVRSLMSVLLSEVLRDIALKV